MPDKIIKVSPEQIYDNEEWFKIVDFNDPVELAYAFGCWLNLYFVPWAPNRSTWMDSNKHVYTTKELLEEFINEYKK